MALVNAGTYQINRGIDSFIADSGSGFLTDAVDIDGNGYTDLLFADGVFPPESPRPTTGDIVLQDAGGFRLLQNAFTGTTHPREFVFSDFNRDGVLDFFIAAHGYDASPFDGESNVLMISQNDAYISQQGELFLPNGFTHSGASADIDGDGDFDFMSVNITPHPQVLLFTNDGDGTFTNSSERLPTTLSRPDSSTQATSSLLHDIDGDGNVDILLGSQHSEGNHLIIYFGSSTGRFADSNKLVLQDAPLEYGNQIVLDIIAMDIDLDGDDDLLTSFTRNTPFYTGAGIQVYRNEGLRDFVNTSQQSLGNESFNPDHSWIISLDKTDFNKDGVVDLYLQTTGSPGLYQPIILLGIGDGTFEPLTRYDLAGTEYEYIFNKLHPSVRNGDVGLLGGQYYQGELLIHELVVESNAVVELDSKVYRNMKLGTSRDDTLRGDDRDNLLVGGLGNDDLRGGLGIDTGSFSGERQHYVITRATTNMFVQDQREFGYGTDTLIEVERLEFDDLSLAIDIDGSAGQTAKTLAAVLGSESLSNQQYVGLGLQLFDAGQSLETVCGLALQAAGATANEQVVNTLYSNLYGEAPTAELAQPFVDALNAGAYSQGFLAAAAAELTDDLGVIDLVGLAETGIEYL